MPNVGFSSTDFCSPPSGGSRPRDLCHRQSLSPSPTHPPKRNLPIHTIPPPGKGSRPNRRPRHRPPNQHQQPLRPRASKPIPRQSPQPTRPQQNLPQKRHRHGLHLPTPPQQHLRKTQTRPRRASRPASRRRRQTHPNRHRHAASKLRFPGRTGTRNRAHRHSHRRAKKSGTAATTSITHRRPATTHAPTTRPAPTLGRTTFPQRHSLRTRPPKHLRTTAHAHQYPQFALATLCSFGFYRVTSMASLPKESPTAKTESSIHPCFLQSVC